MNTAAKKKNEVGKGGRRPIINQEIIKNIIAAIRSGNYMEAAAAYAGVSKDTLYRWLKRGARERNRISKNKRLKVRISEAPYLVLADGVRKSLADAEVRDVSLIAKAAAGGQKVVEEKITYDVHGNITGKTVVTKSVLPQWQAAAWRLERKYPKKWGRRVAIRKDDGTGEDNAEDFLRKIKDGMSTGNISGFGAGLEEEINKGSENDPTDTDVPVSSTDE